LILQKRNNVTGWFGWVICLCGALGLALLSACAAQTPTPDPPTPTVPPAATATKAAPAPTATFAPTATPTATRPGPVAANADWTPVAREFGGVEMVLVPPGCFRMGSAGEVGEADERPAHEQCIGAAFWIDRLEVTNGQFGSVGRWGRFPGTTCRARRSA
jgi:formylglycine-generating enzyme required for sulfatase activity